MYNTIMTPLNHFQPVTETQNTDQDSDDIVTRSREDEKRVFAVISNLFPSNIYNLNILSV